VSEIGSEELVLDIGPKTSAAIAEKIKQAKVIIWNGPVGVFEMEPFEAGTKALSEAIAKSEAFSLAGGGETLSAIGQFGIESEISYISTGGGAFLEYLEGKKLPAVKALEDAFAKQQ
jgi:phosphoglycerate kinase